MKKGDWVKLKSTKERGRIKDLDLKSGMACVVFKCGGKWHKYQQFVGRLVEMNDLMKI